MSFQNKLFKKLTKEVYFQYFYGYQYLGKEKNTNWRKKRSHCIQNAEGPNKSTNIDNRTHNSLWGG